jgi:hypothetical protein
MHALEARKTARLLLCSAAYFDHTLLQKLGTEPPEASGVEFMSGDFASNSPGLWLTGRTGYSLCTSCRRWWVFVRQRRSTRFALSNQVIVNDAYYR